MGNDEGQTVFTVGQRVYVLDHHDAERKSGTVSYLYPDGRTVGIVYDGRKFPCVIPTSYIIPAR